MIKFTAEDAAKISEENQIDLILQLISVTANEGKRT